MTEQEEEQIRMYNKKSEELKQLEMDLSDQRKQTEKKEKQLREAEVQISSVEKQKAELENEIQDLKKESKVKSKNLCFVVWLCADILIMFIINLFTCLFFLTKYKWNLFN